MLYDVNDYETFLKESFSPLKTKSEKINGLTGKKAIFVLWTEWEGLWHQLSATYDLFII